jgi:putative membrane protein
LNRKSARLAWHVRCSSGGAILKSEEVIVRMNANVALLAAGLFVWGGLTAAQAAAAKKSTAESAAKASAQNFLSKAAQANLAELELGRLAADKAENSDVKQFGQKMVDDHGKANKEVEALAGQKGVTLPTYIDAAHKAAKARLEKLSGSAFDRAFAAQMVKDHQAAVTLFRTQARSGKDPDVKAFAEKMLPDLEGHLKMAQDLNRQQRAASR